MSNTKAEVIQALVAEAVVDPATRENLFNDANALAGPLGVVLDPDELKDLETIKADVERFGAQRNVDATDAKSWSIGILQVRSVFTSCDNNNA